MKTKVHLFAATAFALALASCSNEDVLTAVNDGDGNVSFTVSLPGEAYGSRAAFATGLSADKLVWAIYDASDNSFVTKGETTFGSSLTTTVNMTLANGKSYKVAFFAYNASGDVYTFDTDKKTVSVDYAKMTDYNSTDYDAFYKLHEIAKVTGPIQETVTLTRPLAQINWGTSDLAEGAVTATGMYGANAANLVSKVTVKDVYTGFNMLDGTMVGEPTTATFAAKARPDASENSFPVEPSKYQYLSMNYVLVPAAQSLVEAELTPANASADFQSVKVTNMPVQANYRTNIYGALLTNPADFTVTKDKDYATPDYTPVASAEELVAAVANGGTLVMSEDIELTEALPLAADKPVVIDTKGKKLTISASQELTNGQELSIVNSGEAVGRASTDGLAEIVVKHEKAFEVKEGAKLTIENAYFTQTGVSGNNLSMVRIHGSNSSVTVKNCIFDPKVYAISSNADDPKINNIKVTLENVQIKPSAVIACPSLFNVQMDLVAKDCVFEGCNQAIVLRGGNYEFTNCTFRQTLAFDSEGNCTTTKESIKSTFRPQYRSNWGSGNAVPLAAITMGNKGTGYQYPTVVSLKGCKVEIPTVAQNNDNDIDSSLPAVYAYANQGEGLGVTFNYDDATTFSGALEYASANITVNGQTPQNSNE